MDISKDQKLINLILEGNTNAFSEIVNNYKDLVFTLSLKLLKSREKAEEMSQDSFIKIYKNLSSFKGQSKFSSWVYRITYNTCLDELRRQKKHFSHVSINEFTENELKTIDTALTHIEDKEFKATIQKCIDALPNEMGFLLTLYYFEDYSIKEMADVVGEKPNNVKVKLHRSRLKLTELLKKQLEPEIQMRYGHK